MVRLFDIRDVNVVQRLSPLGRALAYEPAAIDGMWPLRDALRAYAGSGIDSRLAMVRRAPEPGGEAFGLLQLVSNSEGEAERQRFAALTFMAPTPRSEESAAAWTDLAENMVSLAASRGATYITAEAPEDGYEAEVLHSIGFNAVVHQDVLKLARLPASLAAPEPPGVRPQQDADDPLIRLLALRVVPKLVQRVETSSDLTRLSHRIDCGFLLFERNELAGQVTLRRGRRGYSMQVLFHPSCEGQAEPLVQYALASLHGRAHTKPIYCSVPSYQSGLLPALDRLGFVHVTSNALMIKHTTAVVKQPVWSMNAKSAARKAAPSGPHTQRSRLEHAPEPQARRHAAELPCKK